MLSIPDYINSGILEMYVLGVTSDAENEEIEKAASLFPEIRTEIEGICSTIETYAESNAIAPDPTLKPFIMAMIQYNERVQGGELISEPPLLTENSKLSDYSEWLNKPYIKSPTDFHNFHTEIIGKTAEVTTAVVWIKYMAPEETHENQLERFLIIEGSCNFNVEDEIISVKAGDYFSIPLNKKHSVTITSPIPCKAILQRIAA